MTKQEIEAQLATLNDAIKRLEATLDRGQAMLDEIDAAARRDPEQQAYEQRMNHCPCDYCKAKRGLK